MKTIFINHSERSSVPKRSRESYRKSRDSGREPIMRDNNVRKSAMTLTCHNYKTPGHKMKDCKQLFKKSDKSSDVENGKKK